MVNRRILIRTCKQHGFILQPAALKAVQECCGNNAGNGNGNGNGNRSNRSNATVSGRDDGTLSIHHMDDFVAVLQHLQRIHPRNASGGSVAGGPLIITAELWSEALQGLYDATKAASAAQSAAADKAQPNGHGHENDEQHMLDDDGDDGDGDGARIGLRRTARNGGRSRSTAVASSRNRTTQPSASQSLTSIRDAFAIQKRKQNAEQTTLNDQDGTSSATHGNPQGGNTTIETLKSSSSSSSSSATTKIPFNVVSAFHMPRLSYDPLRQQFGYEGHHSRAVAQVSVILGSAQDKVDRMIQRYALIQQRLMRHELFRSSRARGQATRQGNFWMSPDALNQPARPALSLTSIDRLLGTKSNDSEHGHSTTLVLFGLLKYNNDSTIQLKKASVDDSSAALLSQHHPFVLEDPTGQVVLDMTIAKSAATQGNDKNNNNNNNSDNSSSDNNGDDDGEKDASALDGFVTDHSMVLVQGVYESDSAVFVVHHLGFPPAESQATSRSVVPMPPYCIAAASTGLISGTGMLNKPSLPPLQLYIISQCHMDQLEVMDEIRRILGIIERRQYQHAAVCFLGNFSSTSNKARMTLTSSSMCSSSSCSASGGRAASAHPLKELATIITESYPFVAKHTQLIFVPGPSDTSLPVLPQPALRSPAQSLLSGIEHWRMATNPCRIAYGEQEIVLFRQGLSDLLMQTQVLQFRNGDVEGSASLRCARTIVEQGHLVPVAPHQRPLFWNCDHALRLYPLPDAVVVGDATPYAHVIEECPVVSPGNVVGGDGMGEGNAKGYVHMTLLGQRTLSRRKANAEQRRRQGNQSEQQQQDVSTLIRLYENGALTKSNESGVFQRYRPRQKDMQANAKTAEKTSNNAERGTEHTGTIAREAASVEEEGKAMSIENEETPTTEIIPKPQPQPATKAKPKPMTQSKPVTNSTQDSAAAATITTNISTSTSTLASRFAAFANTKTTQKSVPPVVEEEKAVPTQVPTQMEGGSQQTSSVVFDESQSSVSLVAAGEEQEEEKGEHDGEHDEEETPEDTDVLFALANPAWKESSKNLNMNMEEFPFSQMSCED